MSDVEKICMSVLYTESKLWKCGEKILCGLQFITYMMVYVCVYVSAFLLQSSFMFLSLICH